MADHGSSILYFRGRKIRVELWDDRYWYADDLRGKLLKFPMRDALKIMRLIDRKYRRYHRNHDYLTQDRDR